VERNTKATGVHIRDSKATGWLLLKYFVKCRVTAIHNPKNMIGEKENRSFLSPQYIHIFRIVDYRGMPENLNSIN